MSKKRSERPQMLEFRPKIKRWAKKGHSFRRCLNFGSTSSDEQNKVIASADVRTSARNQKKNIIVFAGHSLSWWALHSKPGNSEPRAPLCPRAPGQWPLLPPHSAGQTEPLAERHRAATRCLPTTELNGSRKLINFLIAQTKPFTVVSKLLEAL